MKVTEFTRESHEYAHRTIKLYVYKHPDFSVKDMSAKTVAYFHGDNDIEFAGVLDEHEVLNAGAFILRTKHEGLGILDMLMLAMIGDESIEECNANWLKQAVEFATDGNLTVIK